MTAKTIPVTEGALVARLRRKLAHGGIRLKRVPPRMANEYRDWMMTEDNTIIDYDFDLEEEARSWSVMADLERLAS